MRPFGCAAGRRQGSTSRPFEPEDMAKRGGPACRCASGGTFACSAFLWEWMGVCGGHTLVPLSALWHSCNLWLAVRPARQTTYLPFPIFRPPPKPYAAVAAAVAIAAAVVDGHVAIAVAAAAAAVVDDAGAACTADVGRPGQCHRAQQRLPHLVGRPVDGARSRHQHEHAGVRIQEVSFWGMCVGRWRKAEHAGVRIREVSFWMCVCAWGKAEHAGVRIQEVTFLHVCGGGWGKAEHAGVRRQQVRGDASSGGRVRGWVGGQVGVDRAHVWLQREHAGVRRQEVSGDASSEGRVRRAEWEASGSGGHTCVARWAGGRQ
eukprot:366144-Chlamydomonas_euryale.AAC.1